MKKEDKSKPVYLGLAEFYAKTKKDMFDIPIENIELNIDIHQEKEINVGSKIKKKELSCIVCPDKETVDKFILLFGWGDLMTAKIRGDKTIKAVIVKEKRRDNFYRKWRKRNTNGYSILRKVVKRNMNTKYHCMMNTDDIIAHRKLTEPSELEIQRQRWFFNNYKQFENSIVIINGYLREGYDSYRVFKEDGISQILVMDVKINYKGKRKYYNKPKRKKENNNPKEIIIKEDIINNDTFWECFNKDIRGIIESNISNRRSDKTLITSFAKLGKVVYESSITDETTEKKYSNMIQQIFKPTNRRKATVDEYEKICSALSIDSKKYYETTVNKLEIE